MKNAKQQQSQASESAQHTQEEWKVFNGTLVGTKKTERLIATCDNPVSSLPLEEKEANANLIAAAPELLRQLEIAVKHIENIQELYKPEHPFAVAGYKAVIAKAKGGRHA